MEAWTTLACAADLKPPRLYLAVVGLREHRRGFVFLAECGKATRSRWPAGIQHKTYRIQPAALHVSSRVVVVELIRILS
jgi:hypothetical protein